MTTDTATPSPNAADAATPARKRRRWPIALAAFVLLLAAGLLIGLNMATTRLRAEIVKALGPNSEVAAIDAGLSSITISGIRIRAGKDWPATEELAAERVVIRPDWNAILSRDIRLASIEVSGGYVSMLRRKDGKLALLPSLLETRAGKETQNADSGKEKGGEQAALPSVTIDRIVLDGAAVDFFDASVRQPAHKLRLEQVTARLGSVRLPALTGRTDIAIDGTVKGVQRDGKLSLKGWAEIATRDSEIDAKLVGVDLVAFQPYLIKAAETGVKKGTLDLAMKSKVQKNRLHAPGRVTLSGLELSSGKTFMGMPRDAVIGMLKDKKGQIAVDFSLDGNLDDPKFSLNEKFLAQIGTATAGFLGISLEGLAGGIGSAGASAASGIGGAVKKLFGEEK